MSRSDATHPIGHSLRVISLIQVPVPEAQLEVTAAWPPD
jgi:hypothetical protein